MALTDNLVAYYRLQWDAFDSTSNRLDWTINGATLTTDMSWNPNYAYNFDWNDLITLTNAGTFLWQDFTLSSLIYPTSLTWGAQRIFISSTDRYWIGFSASWISAYVYNTAFRTLNVSLATAWIAINNWYHITVTYTSADTSLRMYVNWVLKWTLVVTWGAILTSPSIYLWNWSTLAQWHVWKISSTIIYSRALTNSEIIELATTGFNYPITNNLVSSYKFNWNALDSGWSGFHWTVNGATLTTDMSWNSNSAYAFSGVNQYITVPAWAIPWTFPITIEVVVKPLAVPAWAINDVILQAWARVNNQSYWIAFWWVTQWQKIMVYAWGQPNVYADTTYTIGQTYHIVLTIDSWKVASLFINWVRQVSTQTYPSLVPTSTLREFWRLWLNDWYALNGTIDGVNVWNRVLPDTEILELATETFDNSLKKNLISYHKLDWNSGDTVGLYHGIDTNVTYSTWSWKFGQGASFNGASSYISLWDNIDVWMCDLSYSLWFKTSTVGAWFVWLLNKSRAAWANWRYWTMFTWWELYSFIDFDVPANIWTAVTPQAPFIDWNWHNVVVTMKRTWNITLYVDWVLKQATDISTQSAIDCSATDLLGIWAYQNSTGTAFTQGFFNGSIDEVAIWNRALTSTEVSQLYNSWNGLEYPFVLPTPIQLPEPQIRWKQYEYKLYDRSWNFKQVLTPLVTNKISFTSNINWGQWELSVDLNAWFNYAWAIRTDIVKVWCYSDKFPGGTLIYTWFISKIERKYAQSKSFVTLRCLWIASLLTKMTVNSSYSADPATIIGSVLSAYNSTRTWIDIIAWTLEVVWSTYTTTFSWTTCLEAIRQVTESTAKWFYIWADITLNFISTVDTKRMAIDWEIVSIDITEDLEKIVNSVDVEYTTWTTTRTNPASIALYDTMWKKIRRLEITNLLSAQSFWDWYVAEFWDPKPSITINVNDTYSAWIETLKPWMFVNILNNQTAYNNLQITKIEYTTYNVQLELSVFTSFSQESLW